MNKNHHILLNMTSKKTTHVLKIHLSIEPTQRKHAIEKNCTFIVDSFFSDWQKKRHSLQDQYAKIGISLIECGMVSHIQFWWQPSNLVANVYTIHTSIKFQYSHNFNNLQSLHCINDQND